MVNPSKPPQQPPASKLEDATFLHDEFDIEENIAVELVSDSPVEADRIAEGVRSHDRRKDALAGVPTPREPAADRVADTDEERLKPVLHNVNDRVGGG